MSRYSTRRIQSKALFVAAILSASALSNACQEPIEYETRSDVYSETTGDKYELDVYMLSEWGGNVVPRKETTNIELKFGIAETDKTCKKVRDNKTGKCLDEFVNLQTIPSDAAPNEIKFYPLGFGSKIKGADELAFTCELESKDEKTSKDPNEDPKQDPGEEPSKDPNEDPEQDPGEAPSNDPNDDTPDDAKTPRNTPPTGTYKCTVYTSGVAALKYTWDNVLKPESRASIRIGNGDTSGVSAPIAREYNDYPTAQALNLLDFTADTFGNHNFDAGLTYLQNVLSMSKTTYTASNLYNVPNNLKYVTPYMIVDVPPTNEDGKTDKTDNNLHVAIVGVFDTNALSQISRGVFGTLDVADYCQVINTLEEAYNKNARAFILLPHFAKETSTRTFFNTLFSQIVEPDQIENLKCTPIVSCQSKLIITEKMLADYNKNTSDVETSIKEIQKLIRQEILNNILLVFGPAITNPFLTNVDKELLPNRDACKTCMTEGQCNALEKECNCDALANEDEKEKCKTECKEKINKCNNDRDSCEKRKVKFHEALNCFSVLSDETKLLDYKHFVYSDETSSSDKNNGIWITEFNSKIYTAKAKFTIQKNDEVKAPLKNRYSVHLDKYELVPIFANTQRSEELNPSPQKDKTEINDKNSNYLNISKCDDFLDLKSPKCDEKALSQTQGELSSDKYGYLNSNDCCAYYTNALKYIMNGKLKKPPFDSCLGTIQPQKLDKSEDTSKAATISSTTSPSMEDLYYVQRFWKCMYYAATSTSTGEELHEDICQLSEESEEIQKEEKKKLRVQSTFIGNLVSDAILKHIVKTFRYQKNASSEANENSSSFFTADYKIAENEPDILILNAGTLQEVEDEFIDIDESLLLTLMSKDYNNFAKHIIVSIDDIKDILEHGLNSTTTGAFPVIAGMHVSYSYDKENVSEPEKNPQENENPDIASDNECEEEEENSSVDEEKHYIVDEIIKTNDRQLYEQIYYLSQNKMDAIDGKSDTELNKCILGVIENGKCTIGEYKHIKESDPYYAIFNDNFVVPRTDKNGHKITTLRYKGLDSNTRINLIVTDYMEGGGDGYTMFRDNPQNFQAKTYYDTPDKTNVIVLRDMFRFFFTLWNSNNDNNETSKCYFNPDPNKYDSNNFFTADDLIKYNLRKRIYLTTGIDPKDGDRDPEKSPNVYLDSPANICIPTQGTLTEKFTDICPPKTNTNPSKK